MNIIKRQVWWEDMKKDVTRWVDGCMTCLRFRKMPQKQESPAVVPVAYECWQGVMVDLEGPSTPADMDGCIYTMTYICCVRNGILIEKCKKCNAREARRMFAACVFRSGTIPSMVNSDRGTEFKNALMQEYTALMGIGRRFNTPWRPMELGKGERIHRETQTEVHGHAGE